jgi:hypothetical protein
MHLKEHRDPHWAAWYNGMTPTHAADGGTLLEGALVDQAALYGLISKLRDLGPTPIAVQSVAAEHPGPPQ